MTNFGRPYLCNGDPKQYVFGYSRGFGGGGSNDSTYDPLDEIQDHYRYTA